MTANPKPLALALASTLLLLATASTAAPVEIKFPYRVAGKTPEVIGYNMRPGENQTGSGNSYWLEYAGITAARFWWPSAAWPELPTAWETRDDTLANFEKSRAALRADPLKNIDWTTQNARVAAATFGKPGTLQTLSPAIAELRRLGISPLCPILGGASLKRYPFHHSNGKPDWHGRWAYWRGVYTTVFFLARNYDVQRYQLFNEPDHNEDSTLTIEAYIERFQIGSDAVRAAIDDVNRLTGKKLQSIISGPVTAGIYVYHPRNNSKDPRDSKRGWGQTLVTLRNADFAGRTLTPRRPLFDHYAVQYYTRSPQDIAKKGAQLLAALRKDCGKNAPPLIVSEANVATGTRFLTVPENIDSPTYYSAFGAMASAYMKLGAKEFYVYRITQISANKAQEIKKNGMHIADTANPLTPIVRSTKGAEAARLFIRTLKGGLDRMEDPAKTLPEKLTLVTVREPRTGEARVLLANTATNAQHLRLNFTDWPLALGSLITVAEVSERAHGAITHRATLDKTKTLDLEVPATSNLSIRITPAPAAAETKHLRITFPNISANSPQRIARVWLDNPDGTPHRIAGHITLGTKTPLQWLPITATETTLRIRVEPQLPTDAPLPTYETTLE